MLSGPFTRTRKSQKRYKAHLEKAASKCDFCDFNKNTPHLKKEYKHFWLVENIYGYDLWDSQGVKEHLMIVPKRHVQKINQLSAAELKEYVQLLGEFEEQGYSTYTRSLENITLSMAHKHTHLIKMDNKRKKALLFIHKPHIVVYF